MPQEAQYVIFSRSFWSVNPQRTRSLLEFWRGTVPKGSLKSYDATYRSEHWSSPKFVRKYVRNTRDETPYCFYKALSAQKMTVSGHNDHDETETRSARVSRAPCNKSLRKIGREIEPDWLRCVSTVKESCGCCRVHSNYMACVFVAKPCITALLCHGQYLHERYSPPYWMSP